MLTITPGLPPELGNYSLKLLIDCKNTHHFQCRIFDTIQNDRTSSLITVNSHYIIHFKRWLIQSEINFIHIFQTYVLLRVWRQMNDTHIHTSSCLSWEIVSYRALSISIYRIYQHRRKNRCQRAVGSEIL